MTTSIKLKPVIRIPTNGKLYSINDAQMAKAQSYRCFYCNKVMNPNTNGKMRQSKDHFFPKSHGFSLMGNKVLACGGCNSAKNDKYPTLEAMARFVKMYSKFHYVANNHILKTLKDKPRFRLSMTAELISTHCR